MNHQRLKCYAKLLDLAKRVPQLVVQVPRGEGYLIDQFKRALSSAILNLAEGNGRSSARERRRFFDISLASIAEVSSVIDLMQAYGYLRSRAGSEWQNELRISYAMIMNLKKSSL